MPLERRELRRWDGARHRPVLFSRSGCTRCTLIREALASHGLTAIELSIDLDDRALRLLLTITGRAWVPTVIFHHEVAIGCDADRVEELLATPYEPLEDDSQDEELEAEDYAGVEPGPDAVLAVEAVELDAR